MDVYRRAGVACSPGTTSYPDCPRSAGSTAVSSRCSSSSARPSSSAGSAASVEGLGRHGGGATRLLNRKVPYLYQQQNRRKKGQHVSDEQLTSPRPDTRRKRHVHQQRKAHHLRNANRPNEHLPSEHQTDDPDAQCSTCIRQTPRRRTHVPRHAQPKEIEERDGERDSHPRPQHRGRVNHLAPPPRQVKEGRQVGVVCEHGKREQNRECTEESFVPDRDKRRDRVARHNFLCGCTAQIQMAVLVHIIAR